MCKTGNITTLYDSADHYWDFEQSPVSEIADVRTSTKITVHGSPIIIPSPTGKSIYLQGTTYNSSVDLMQVDSSSCLFDPSNCSSGLSMGMFFKFRARGKSRTINGTQMFFGNSQGIDLRQGVTIYFNESSGRLNVAVFGSTNYCFRTVGLVRNSWSYLHLTWKSIGELNLYMEHHTSSNGYLTCGTMTTPFPTNTMYSLGHIAFPTVYIDNLAIWFRDKQPFNAPWTYITGKVLRQTSLDRGSGPKGKFKF